MILSRVGKLGEFLPECTLSGEPLPAVISRYIMLGDGYYCVPDLYRMPDPSQIAALKEELNGPPAETE